MKNKFLLITTLFVFILQYLPAQSVSTFINELYYLADNPTDKGLEIVGQSGSNMAGYEIAVYAADGTLEYVEYISDGVIPSKQNGYGAIWYDIDQTGDGGAVALISPNAAIIQFLSYGTLNYANNLLSAVDGPAVGLTAQYIGAQSNVNQSLQLIGTGLVYVDFLWSIANPGLSPGETNLNQQFLSLLSLNQPSNIINQEESESILFQSFPNPVIETLHIQLQNSLPEDAIIMVYQSNGQLLNQQNIPAFTNQVDIDFTFFTQGTYLVTIQASSHVITSQVVVKQ